MEDISFEIDESHMPLWERTDWRYAFIMGGRGNGRSGTASRFSVSQLFSKEYTRGAMMRAVHADIRASCWGEVMDRFSEQGIPKGGTIKIDGKETAIRVTDNEMYVEIGDNSLRAHGFKASSGSLTARLKSLAGYNLIWGEEGEEIGEDEFRTLDDSLRTVKGRIRIIITLNTPPKNHWIIRKFFNLIPHPEAPGFYIPVLKPEHAKDTVFITGTYRENIDNLDSHTIERYKAYKDTNPAYYWQVIEGLSPDEVRGKIYSGWQIVESVPAEARLVSVGEDFGWFPDPAAAVAVYYCNGSYYLDEIAYGTELTNEFLAGEIKTVVGNRPIITIADSAEPKSIAEQRKYGINVQPCAKGSDSVGYGIKVVSQKKIFVTRRSTNVWESYENYAWAEDKDGNPKGEPVHTYSHAMDAIRYAFVSMHNRVMDKPQGRSNYKKVNIAV